MKQKLLFSAITLGIMMASCSSEDIQEPQAKGNNDIVFTDVVSRAATVETNDKKHFGEFYVSARYHNEDGTHTPYFHDDKYSKKDGQNTWTIADGQAHTWPSGKLDFFAHANTDNCQWNGGNPTIPFEVNEDATQQTDLLVACITEQGKPETGNKVNLNFRHALSQIVFMAKNTSQHLKFKIDGIKVCNAFSQGTFTYTSAFDLTDPTKALNSNGWADRKAQKDFAVTFAPVELTNLGTEDASKAVTMSLNNDGTFENNNILMMLPQTSTYVEGAPKSGIYFLISCQIYNVTTINNEKSETLIWGSETKGADVLVAPKSDIVWLPGVKYCYTFNFNNSAGYDPSKPTTEVLTDIAFDVTVDNWDWENSSEIEAGTSAQTTPATPAE